MSPAPSVNSGRRETAGRGGAGSSSSGGRVNNEAPTRFAAPTLALLAAVAIWLAVLVLALL